MRRVCRAILVVLIVAYGVALLIGLTGTYGWFGQPTDPLSWIFVSLLGLPWILLVDAAPNRMAVAFAALAPLAGKGMRGPMKGGSDWVCETPGGYVQPVSFIR